MKRRRKLWDPHKRPAENASSVLPQLAAEFFASGRKAAKETSYEALHKFRLTVKRFRYTLEAFRPLYGPGLEQRIEKLRTIQQLLGHLNDCATTRRLLERSADAGTEEVQQVVEFIDSRSASAARKVTRHWIEDFDANGEESIWKRYLARQANRKASRAKR